MRVTERSECPRDTCSDYQKFQKRLKQQVQLMFVSLLFSFLCCVCFFVAWVALFQRNSYDAVVLSYQKFQKRNKFSLCLFLFRLCFFVVFVAWAGWVALFQRDCYDAVVLGSVKIEHVVLTCSGALLLITVSSVNIVTKRAPDEARKYPWLQHVDLGQPKSCGPVKIESARDGWYSSFDKNCQPLGPLIVHTTKSWGLGPSENSRKQNCHFLCWAQLQWMSNHPHADIPDLLQKPGHAQQWKI